MATFWDEFKDLFKTKKQKDEEKSQELKSALAAEKSVDDKLEELERKYTSSIVPEEEPDLEELFPTSLGLEKIDYEPESDGSIEARVKSAVDYDKATDVNALDGKTDKAVLALQEQSDTAEKTRAEKERELAELYSQLAEGQKNDSVKRGVARGSILSGLLDGLESQEGAAAADVKAAYEESVNAIDAEIDRVKDARETALSELDLKYAEELASQISKLKKERDDTVAKYVKYNNGVEEKERKYAEKREDDVAKYLEDREAEKAQKEKEQREYEAKYGYSGEKLQNYSERYQLAYDFYMSLSGDIAADALDASPNMRYYLGNYYDKLMKELKSRDTGKKYF